LPLPVTQKVDGVEFRIILVEFFPNWSSSCKAEYSCFVFGYMDEDVVSQDLLPPAFSSFFFVQGTQKDVGDDTGVRRLPALDVYMCNRGCVLDFGSSDREVHGMLPYRRLRDDREPPMPGVTNEFYQTLQAGACTID
jgi:hypothetical protein